MATFLHTADIHIGTFKRAELPFEAKLARYRGILQFIFVTARKQKVDYIVLAGDIFEYKDPHPKERDLLLQALLHYNDIPVLLIPGNHDEVEEGYTTLHFLSLLQDKGKLPHLYFTEVSPRIVEFDDIRFVLVPYTGDEERYGYNIRSILKKMPEDDRPIVVVGHEMVRGVSDDSGWTAKSGVRLPKLKRVCYWAMGDIHMRQSLSGLPNAWYPGSPAQHKFSEAPDKGVLIVDTNDPAEPKFVPNTHPAVRTLVAIDSDDPEVLKDVPNDVWVSLKTSNIDAMRESGVNIIKSTPRKAKGKARKQEIREVKKLARGTTDPLQPLKGWLVQKLGFTKEDAAKADKLARDLV